MILAFPSHESLSSLRYMSAVSRLHIQSNRFARRKPGKLLFGGSRLLGVIRKESLVMRFVVNSQGIFIFERAGEGW